MCQQAVSGQLPKLFLKAITGKSFRKSEILKYLVSLKHVGAAKKEKTSLEMEMELHLYTMVLSLLYTFQPLKRRLHHQQGVLKAFFFT